MCNLLLPRANVACISMHLPSHGFSKTALAPIIPRQGLPTITKIADKFMDDVQSTRLRICVSLTSQALKNKPKGYCTHQPACLSHLDALSAGLNWSMIVSAQALAITVQQASTILDRSRDSRLPKRVTGVLWSDIRIVPEARLAFIIAPWLEASWSKYRAFWV